MWEGIRKRLSLIVGIVLFTDEQQRTILYSTGEVNNRQQ
jgi:hypothetical protein